MTDLYIYIYIYIYIERERGNKNNKGEINKKGERNVIPKSRPL